MTAQTSAQSIQECKNAGMNEHIGKPIDEEKLINILQNFTHRK